MSHIRRKRPSQPVVRNVRKKKNEVKWIFVFILILLIMGTIIGIIFIVIASP
ncbi:MAG: hypothetical protein ACFFAH_08720 [Promethearchaeota archaeon]